MHAAWDRLASTLPNEGADTNWGPPDLLQEPVYRVCLEHPYVVAAVAALLDSDFRAQGVHGRSPPRGHGRQGLHIDWMATVPPDRQILANAFWVLDDLARDNGGTRVVPGSHRWVRAPRGAIAQPSGAHPEERYLEASAGDVIVFTGHLWHSGSLNESGRRRRVAIAQFSRPEVTVPYAVV
jgi:ectoine hydroxylase-related dioxygenase (phytanoyl-CoA dioxygenase family)